MKKINKKMAAKALATVLSAKVRDGELLILNELSVSKPKTREAAALLRNLTSVKTDIMGKRPRALVLLAEGQAELRRAFRNLPSVELEEARNLTALQALKRKYLLLPKTSLEVLERRLAVVEPRIASENVSAADFGRNQKTTAVQDRTRSRTRRTNTA